MTGYRTILLGLLLAIGPTAVDYLLKIDWTQHVDAKWVPIISGVLMVAMRYITKTPVGGAK